MTAPWSATAQGVDVLGIPIPSSSPVFLAVVAIHVAAGLGCVVAGAVAMLSAKRAGRHPFAGTFYFWSLVVVFVTMAVLALFRWPHDTHLLILGVVSLTAGMVGRGARRRAKSGWIRLHITGMGGSYIALLTAFYVDNGPHLPVWRHFSPWTYWLAPSVVGLPILIWALVQHPMVRRKHDARLTAT